MGGVCGADGGGVPVGAGSGAEAGFCEWVKAALNSVKMMDVEGMR
jgi:hypothetical protein